jgi:hypothetical protein
VHGTAATFNTGALEMWLYLSRVIVAAHDTPPGRVIDGVHVTAALPHPHQHMNTCSCAYLSCLIAGDSQVIVLQEMLAASKVCVILYSMSTFETFCPWLDQSEGKPRQGPVTSSKVKIIARSGLQ